MQQEHQPITSVEELGTIKVKISVIAGAKDLDDSNPELLHEVFNKCKLVIVPGNHNGTYRTTEFSKAILLFL